MTVTIEWRKNGHPQVFALTNNTLWVVSAVEDEVEERRPEFSDGGYVRAGDWKVTKLKPKAGPSLRHAADPASYRGLEWLPVGDWVIHQTDRHVLELAFIEVIGPRYGRAILRKLDQLGLTRSENYGPTKPTFCTVDDLAEVVPFKPPTNNGGPENNGGLR
jgi:hypothetical protein